MEGQRRWRPPLLTSTTKTPSHQKSYGRSKTRRGVEGSSQERPQIEYPSLHYLRRKRMLSSHLLSDKCSGIKRNHADNVIELGNRRRQRRDSQTEKATLLRLDRGETFRCTHVQRRAQIRHKTVKDNYFKPYSWNRRLPCTVIGTAYHVRGALRT